MGSVVTRSNLPRLKAHVKSGNRSPPLELCHSSSLPDSWNSHPTAPIEKGLAVEMNGSRKHESADMPRYSSRNRVGRGWDPDRFNHVLTSLNNVVASEQRTCNV